ncbi:hypothetical protein [Streptomyces sp. NPDC017673]
MPSYGFIWTNPDRTTRASAVAYNEVSAGQRRDDIERVDVKPGELPTPRR